MPPFKDLTGMRFGRLSVIGRADGKSPSNKTRWHVQCDCGATKVVEAQAAQVAKGCGVCTLGRHRHATDAGQTPEYAAWKAAKARCHRPQDKAFRWYGARGIRMCERWRKDFAAFLEDMGPRPSPRHSLDRINNDGDYEPSNCRWATKREQSRNTSQVVMLTFQGETMCLKDWARRIGMSRTGLAHRLDAGWPLGIALTTGRVKGTHLIERLMRAK